MMQTFISTLKDVVARRLILIALPVALMVPAAAHGNLLTNPGFEDGPTGPIGDGMPGWSVWANSGWHHDDAGKTIDIKAIKLWWDDSFVWQDVSVTAGAEYDFSVMALSASDDPLNLWNGLLKAEFYDNLTGTGSPLVAVDIDRFFSASDPLDTWIGLSGSVVAPPTAVMGRMILSIADWQPNPSGSLNFDEASITVVPEPATLGLFFLGLLVAVRRRRA